MKYKIYFTVFLSMLFLLNGCSQKEKRELSIIPKPSEVEVLDGNYTATDKIVIVTEWKTAKVKDILHLFTEKLRTINGLKVVVSDGLPSKATHIIVLKHDDNLHKEGYKLSVSKSKIVITASQVNGLFYAFQTIFQLLPAQIFSNSKTNNITFSLPCVKISDAPKYQWRGFMLDVSRHFFPKEFIFKVIDYLAMHKMNVFHWHLVDDQGWRIEIKKYPKLTEIGAWRADREDQPWNSVREPQRKGEKATYGGFYTQEDIKEVIKYAADRFITIVPEIEMPGHCTSALAAYPQYSCTGGPFTVPVGSIWKERNVYCAGNDGTFEFLNNILTEVAELFPSKYIHIGGDEAKKDAWEKCPKCQKRMKEEGLTSVEELQGYFVNRIEKFLISRNKRLIGWDEILEDGLSPSATVMSWRGLSGGIASSRKGHDVVFSPNTYCYFDYYQGNPDYEPPAYNKFLSLKKVYSFDPSLKDSLTEKERKHILGVQANLWTEYVPTQAQAEYMMFPRLAALAEVAWRENENRDWNNFSERLEKQFKRYDALGVNYSKSSYNVNATYAVDKTEHNLIVTLKNEIANTQIRYTTDGTEPNANSKLYVNPFHVSKRITVKAAAFRDSTLLSRITTLDVLANKATGLPVKVEFPFDERYPSSREFALTDGVIGTISYRGGDWQGYFGVDLNATIKLLNEEKISKVSTSFLQSINAGIFFPKEIEIWVSNDGKDFKKVSTLNINTPETDGGTIIKIFTNKFSPIKTRYVKVIAKTIGKCPKGHKYEGGNAFMFVSEIIVE